PRLLEVVGTEGVGSLAAALETVTTAALAPAEAGQASTGGGNPRLAAALGGTGVPPATGVDVRAPAVTASLVVSDRPELADAVAPALTARGVAVRVLDAGGIEHTFDGTAAALADVVAEGPVDGIVVALAGTPPAADLSPGWERALAEHTGITDQIYADAAWARAAGDHANATGAPLRLVVLTDAVSAGGRSRAQAAAQHARSARGATDDRLAAFAVAVESAASPDLAAAAELTAHLVASPTTPALSGAELAVGPGWLGLRSHPRVRASLSFHDHTVAPWLDDVLADLSGGPTGGTPT
ncbi:MAG TPA: hypothetical protein PKA98_13995, partial [Acidimicrobiales bacterium]|nr:hypothetical protein [Acidimicrobiales bacterium]